ncbi:hypothetical protein J4E08_15455 [Sagittula sp. NFXS13]|uniref:hypothetical protein n=1 Tax=Sagittula sp. NFXS13 TaxID=2819095 RepID=UPI0032DEFE3B
MTARRSLISGVASNYPTPEIKSAATAATTRSTAAAATRSAAAATTRSTAAAAARSAAAAAFADCDFSVQGTFAQPLWHGLAPPDGLRPNDLGPSLLDTDPRFDFFARWYNGMLLGTPLDWSLQERVALIRKDTWDAGIDDVAKAIAKIERAFRTEVGPRPVVNAAGLVDIEMDQSIGREPLAFACGQVDVALLTALASDAGNGLSETSVETGLIRTALERHGDQPSVIATSFWSALMSLDRQIGDIYPETSALLILKNTLYVSVEEICGEDEVIRARIGRLAALETRRMPTPAERADILEVPSVVADLTTPKAQSELEEMVEIVAKTDNPPKMWRARLVNWLTVLGQFIDKGQKNEKRADWLVKLGGRIAKWFVGLDGDDSGDVP